MMHSYAAHQSTVRDRERARWGMCEPSQCSTGQSHPWSWPQGQLHARAAVCPATGRGSEQGWAAQAGHCTRLQALKDLHVIGQRQQGAPWTALSCVFHRLQRVTQLFCNNELFRVKPCCCCVYWGWSFQLQQLKLRATEEGPSQHMLRSCFVMLRYFPETTAYSTLINTLIREPVRINLQNS